jgi:hypothetical protein
MASEIIPSVLAGILDTKGGIRVVITPESQVPCHLNEGERAFVVPGVIIDRILPSKEYPKLINQAMEYVRTHAG